MSEFVFLYRGGEPPAGSPEEMQQQMQRWMGWLKGLADQGFVKDPGHPLEKGGMVFSGMSPDGELPEIVERPDHPWFVGVQFHPELKSRPFDPHPLFSSFIGAAVERSRLV